MNTAVIDIETGGFSITKNGVCEIAAVILSPKFEILDTFQTYIKPYKRENSEELVSYKDDAMAVNGISMEQLEAGKEVEHAVMNFFDFLEGQEVQTIVAHGRHFDFPRIEYVSRRFVGSTLDNFKKECTIDLAKSKLNVGSYSLENLCEFLGISNEKAHSALGDALATARLYEILKK